MQHTAYIVVIHTMPVTRLQHIWTWLLFATCNFIYSGKQELASSLQYTITGSLWVVLQFLFQVCYTIYTFLQAEMITWHMKCSGFLVAIPSSSPTQCCVLCWHSLPCAVSQEDQETGIDVAKFCDHPWLHPDTRTTSVFHGPHRLLSLI